MSQNLSSAAVVIGALRASISAHVLLNLLDELGKRDKI